MSKIASFLLGACCMLVAGALVVFSYPWTGNTWMGSASMVSDGRPTGLLQCEIPPARKPGLQASGETQGEGARPEETSPRNSSGPKPEEAPKEKPIDPTGIQPAALAVAVLDPAARPIDPSTAKPAEPTPVPVDPIPVKPVDPILVPPPPGPVASGSAPCTPVVEDKPAVDPNATIEQLLELVAQIKAEREKLAKREQEVVAAVQKKLREQQERLKKLGLSPAEGAEPMELNEDKRLVPTPQTLEKPMTKPEKE